MLLGVFAVLVLTWVDKGIMKRRVFVKLSYGRRRLRCSHMLAKPEVPPREDLVRLAFSGESSWPWGRPGYRDREINYGEQTNACSHRNSVCFTGSVQRQFNS